MAKKKAKAVEAQPRKLYVRPDCELPEFLKGATLRYVGFGYRTHEATFQPGVGVRIERKGKPVGVADVKTAAEARRLYHNLTRRPARPGAEDE
jgi:hypothetical protein